MGKFQDLTGQKFGRLTVIKRAKDKIRTNGKHKVMWECQCECGNIKDIDASSLKSGRVNSCGCYKKELLSKKHSGKLEGKRFGKLTVIKRLRSNKKQNVVWLCKCDCGNFTEATTDLLNKGEKLSCGCRNREALLERNTTHGLTHTRLYGIWSGMKARCYNPNRDEYKWYGAKGVTICEEWKNDFQKFYDWSLANGYNDNLTIDRINPYGDYEPANCRWATWSEQNFNKRKE